MFPLEPNVFRNETKRNIVRKYIFNYHPLFKKEAEHLLYNRDESTRIEGGDELVLSSKVLAVGISQRTDVASIEKLAKNYLRKNRLLNMC